MASEQSPGDLTAKKIGGWGGAISSIAHALAALVVPVFFVGADLYLGPQFMTAYVDKMGKADGLLVTVIPWSLSLATTGFQYLTIQLIRQVKWKAANKETKLAILAGLIVLIFDTSSDVGGMTSMVFGPEKGAEVIPSEVFAWLQGGEYTLGQAVFQVSWLVLAALTIGICGFQEYFLGEALKWQKGEVALGKLPGANILEGLVKFCDSAFGVFRGVSMAFATIFILLLDVALSVYFLQQMFEAGGANFGFGMTVVCLLISVGLTGYQVLSFRQIRRRTAQLATITDPKAKRTAKMTIGRKSTIMLLFTGIDVYFDIGGFTMLMYGVEEGLGMIPTDPALAWWVVAGVIFGLCAFYEFLMESAYSSQVFDALPGKAGALLNAKAPAVSGRPGFSGKTAPGIPGGGMPAAGAPGMPPGMPGMPPGMPGMPPSPPVIPPAPPK